MPPQLRMYYQAQRYGSQMWFDWPAGIMRQGEAAHTVYTAFQQMTQLEAGELVAWSKKNPALWNVATSVMAYRGDYG